MSGRLMPGAWPAAALTPEAADQVVRSGAVRADVVEAAAQTTRRLAWTVGAGGVLAGLIGLGTAAWVLTTAEPPRHHFSTLDAASGRVEAAVSATDAPRLFTTGTAHQYLRMFAEACAGYVHELRQRNYERCTALMAPLAQTKYRDLFTSANPDSPQTRVGAAATLTPENLRYDAQPSSGRIQSWLVRYVQTERRNGQTVGRAPWAVTVHFEWHPEARMTGTERAWNAAGMRILDFNFRPDIPQ